LSEKDTGIYDAFNKGVSLAKGEYICFLNTDDWYEPDFIENAVETLISSNADWVFGDNFFHNLDGTIQFIPGDPLYFIDSWKTFSRFHHTTVLVRKACFDEVGLFPLEIENRKRAGQKIRICNDYYWFLKLQLAGKIGIYDYRITGHMEYGGISTTQHSEAAREAFLIAKNVFGNNRKIRSAWRKRKSKNLMRKIFGFLYRKAPLPLRRKIRIILGKNLSSFIYEKLIA
jgi:glycosyltransferase involved in cell wall biosynthesis